MSDQRTAELMEVSLGQYGSEEITGTSAVTPATGFYFCAIQILDDTVVSAQTDYGTTNADLTAFTVLSTGSVLYGKWTSITLTSGEAIGYLASK